MKYKITEYIAIFAFALMIIVFFYFSINLVSYFDPLSRCYINIDQHTLRGNRTTIQKAIRLLKKNDYASYKVLCQFVHRVTEEFCWSAGCYIKGSKIVLLTPIKNDNDLVVQKRAQTLKYHALQSKDFWENFSK